MDQDVFDQFLKSRYLPTLQHARRRAAHHQRIAKGLEWALIILSAITSILLTISSFLRTLPITPIMTILCSLFRVVTVCRRCAG